MLGRFETRCTSCMGGTAGLAQPLQALKTLVLETWGFLGCLYIGMVLGRKSCLGLEVMPKAGSKYSRIKISPLPLLGRAAASARAASANKCGWII